MYSHFTDADLSALRDRLHAALIDRLTGATAASAHGRTVQFQQRTEEIRKELAAVAGEIEARTGRVQRRPIYLV